MVRHPALLSPLLPPCGPTCCLQAKEITNNVAPEPFRWTVEGMLALQEATEDFIVRRQDGAPQQGCTDRV